MKLIEAIKHYRYNFFVRLLKGGLRKTGIILETFYCLKYNILIDEIKEKLESSDFSDIRELSYQDFVQSNLLTEAKLKLFQTRFISPDFSCFGIMIGEEIAYYTWISWQKMIYPQVFEKTGILPPENALFIDSFCNLSFRGRGFHSRTNLKMLETVYLKPGKSTVSVLILKENTPALNVQLKCGFKIVNEYTVLRIKNKIKYFNKVITK